MNWSDKKYDLASANEEDLSVVLGINNGMIAEYKKRLEIYVFATIEGLPG